MKLATIALTTAGYVLCAKAGRERYEQIAAAMEAASARLEEFSCSRPPAPGDPPAAARASTSRFSRKSR